MPSRLSGYSSTSRDQKLMAPLLGLLSIVCGLWFLFGMPIVVSAFAWEHRRGGANTRFVIALVMLLVFYISAGMIWRLGTANWSLSFIETLAASVNSEKYGHPLEHRAETMVVWLLMFSTSTALVAGAVTAVVHAGIRQRKSRT
jgi:hypothetical protein